MAPNKEIDERDIEVLEKETGEDENLGEEFGVPPNGPDDEPKIENIEIDEDDALFAEEQQRKQDFNRD